MIEIYNHGNLGKLRKFVCKCGCEFGADRRDWWHVYKDGREFAMIRGRLLIDCACPECHEVCHSFDADDDELDELRNLRDKRAIEGDL